MTTGLIFEKKAIPRIAERSCQILLNNQKFVIFSKIIFVLIKIWLNFQVTQSQNVSGYRRLGLGIGLGFVIA